MLSNPLRAGLRRRCGAVLCIMLAGCAAQNLLAPVSPRAVEKINGVHARVPRTGELPSLVGRLQQRRVQRGETLLDVAREAGLGFQQLQDANRGLDEWLPTPGAEAVIPSRWILPRSRFRGLIINVPEMRVYLFPPHTQAGETVTIWTWPIGIGTDQAPSPVGTFAVRAKERNPTWYVPDSIFRSGEYAERVVPPGPDNPLGEYRIRLSKGLYEIHGTDSPWSIGRQTTHGCIRLYPEDIGQLYAHVEVGTPGQLMYQVVKFGEAGGDVYVEVHDDVYGRVRNLERYAFVQARQAGLTGRIDPARVRTAVRERTGVPVNVSRR